MNGLSYLGMFLEPVKPWLEDPAVSEIMINGNLADALKNIRALSSEVVADGSMVVPYALIDGIVVSGK